MVTIFLLVGCLGYSNSAVNPILYAFLSDNFKKSFMKACVCAEQREVNKALGGENSGFSRRSRSDGSRMVATSRNDTKDKNELRTRASTSANASCNAMCCSLVLSQEHLEQTMMANTTELEDYQSQYPCLSTISIGNNKLKDLNSSLKI